jgi:dihydrofolate synthase/folylpolyglutamate synthase
MWAVNSLPSMNFNDALTYLLSLGHETLAIKLGLEKTELLLKALDDPQNSFLKVQIAGTNGKGSTAAFVDAICREAGIRTGLYTSTHQIKITDRNRIDGEEIE